MVNLLDDVVQEFNIVGGLPTLLTPGNLIVRKKIPGLNDSTPMEYLKDLVKTKMFEYGGGVKSIADLVFLVEAKTGSGKSTTMPVELFRLLKHSDENSVIVTQPKVLTAQDIPLNQIFWRAMGARHEDRGEPIIFYGYPKIETYYA